MNTDGDTAIIGALVTTYMRAGAPQIIKPTEIVGAFDARPQPDIGKNLQMLSDLGHPFRTLRKYLECMLGGAGHHIPHASDKFFRHSSMKEIRH